MNPAMGVAAKHALADRTQSSAGRVILERWIMRREPGARRACVGAPPAIANAVVDALRHLGVTHLDIPITPEKVWQVLKKAGVAE